MWNALYMRGDLLNINTNRLQISLLKLSEFKRELINFYSSPISSEIQTFLEKKY